MGLLCFVVACGEPPAPAIREVSQEEVLALHDRADGPLLLDVRTPEEFAVSHIPGAVNVPHTEIAERLPRILPLAGQGVIVYCRSGKRAGIGGQILLEAGVEVGHLQGDMLGWEEAGLPVMSMEDPP